MRAWIRRHANLLMGAPFTFAALRRHKEMLAPPSCVSFALPNSGDTRERMSSTRVFGVLQLAGQWQRVRRCLSSSQANEPCILANLRNAQTLALRRLRGAQALTHSIRSPMAISKAGLAEALGCGGLKIGPLGPSIGRLVPPCTHARSFVPKTSAPFVSKLRGMGPSRTSAV